MSSRQGGNYSRRGGANGRGRGGGGRGGFNAPRSRVRANNNNGKNGNYNAQNSRGRNNNNNNHHNNGGGGGGAGGKHDASGQRVSDSPSRGMQSGSVKISRALIEWASSPEAEAAVNEINSNLRCEVRVLFRF